ncbi:FAD-binding oxidoreductase [bacterium]|nr:MAG: FAD-binding oxidoreductase [bacterium]
MSSIAVIGSGFSGISVCYHLIKKGITPVLFDAGLPQKASSVPLGLINPATGQKALPAWNYEHGLEASFKLLSEFQSYTHHPIFDKNGVIRPAMNESMADSFNKNADLFDGSVQFLSSDVFKKEFPAVFSDFGGLVINNAGTVSGSKLFQAFTTFSRKHQIETIHENVERIIYSKAEITVSTPNQQYHFDKVVICTGSVLPGINDLDIRSLVHPVKGQLTRLNVSSFENLPQQSISGLGYLARLNEEFVFGSTFEHHFTHLSPTEDGAQRLQEQLSRLIPFAKYQFSFGRQWVGVRASTPDRKPLLGSFNEFPNLHFYLGNGSKGMLWSVMLGEYVVNQLLNESEIPTEVDIKRFAKKLNLLS